MDDFVESSGVLGSVSTAGKHLPLEQLSNAIDLASVKKFVRSLQAQIPMDEQRR